MHIQQACEGTDTLAPLNKRILTLLGEYSVVHVLSIFDMDPTQGLLALTCNYKVNFDTKNGVERNPHNFDDVVSRVPTIQGINRGAPLLMLSCVSATGMRMPLKECDQTLQNSRCVVLTQEVPTYTGLPEFPISEPL